MERGRGKKFHITPKFMLVFSNIRKESGHFLTFTMFDMKGFPSFVGVTIPLSD